MTDREKAELTLKNLENIRKHLLQEQAELADERGRVALGAHTGDKKSRDRLDEINIASAKFASEFASIEAAIIEANKNLDAAQATEAEAADREAAKALREKLAKLVELGLFLDDCFADFKSAAIEMKQVLDDIHNLGQNTPTAQSFKVNCDLAFKTALMGTPFWSQDFPALGYGQKKTFKSLVDS